MITVVGVSGLAIIQDGVPPNTVELSRVLDRLMVPAPERDPADGAVTPRAPNMKKQ